MGYGEGLITAQIGNIRGCSGDLCTSEEALMDLAIKLLNHEETKRLMKVHVIGYDFNRQNKIKSI